MSKTATITLAFFVSIVLLYGETLFGQYAGAYPGTPVEHYYQPVRLQGPDGTKVAFAISGRFVERPRMPHAVGLLVGADYRVRITDIPLHPGKELFPSVKVIGRTFPPHGRELEFPIVIDITQEDLELALQGRFITRVVYLEDPRAAVPIRGDVGTQPSVDVVGADDPVRVAASLGQPVAIVRLGGRIPSPEALAGKDPSFYHGCPPWMAADKTASGRDELTLYRNTFSSPSPAPFQAIPAPVMEQAREPVTPIPVRIGSQPVPPGR